MLILHIVWVQLDRLIQVQPSQAQALNSQLPPGFMYVPAACLPADYQASLQLQTPPPATQMTVPANPAPPASFAGPAPSPTASAPVSASAADDSRSGIVTIGAGAGGVAQQIPGLGPAAVVTLPGQAGVLPAIGKPDAADPHHAAAGQSAATASAVEEEYEPLAVPASTRARGPRDKTPRRPRTGEAAQAGAARVGKRSKRGH